MFAVWRLWRRFGGWRAIMAQGLLAARLYRDTRVPVAAKLIFPAALLYWFSPINLAFEWIPFIGQIDDVGIAMLAIGAFLKACPQHLVAEHAFRLEEEMERKRPFQGMGPVGRFTRPSFDKWTQRNGRPPTEPR